MNKKEYLDSDILVITRTLEWIKSLIDQSSSGNTLLINLQESNKFAAILEYSTASLSNPIIYEHISKFNIFARNCLVVFPYPSSGFVLLEKDNTVDHIRLTFIQQISLVARDLGITVEEITLKAGTDLAMVLNSKEQ